MIPGFENTYEGKGPHYEVWYGKVNVEPERALWYRYTIFDGELHEASTWAILFDGDDTTGGRNYWDLDELDRPNTVVLVDGMDPDRFYGNRQVFHVDGAHLDEANAIGSAGEISWDLEWLDSGRRFQYVPPFLANVGLVSSAYDACLLDTRVSGTIRAGDREWNVERRPGMVGHIRGSKIAAQTWAWAHCNCFDDADDAVFEGLSARVGVLGSNTPALSAFVLHVDGREYTFRTPLSLLQADSSFNRDEWRFAVEAGNARLTGRAASPDPSRVALVEYDDTDGSKLWCYNSKLARLTLQLEDLADGYTRELHSENASAFEYTTREKPDEQPLI